MFRAPIFSRGFSIREAAEFTYNLIPELTKQPIACTFKYLSTETLRVKGGIFRANKYAIILADPFLGRLIEPYFKNAIIFIEDSPGRLVLKSDIPGGYVEISDISNVIR